MKGNLSVKADVYSFGVVVLELISSQKNFTFNLDPDCVNLLDWVRSLIVFFFLHSFGIVDSIGIGIRDSVGIGIRDSIPNYIFFYRHTRCTRREKGLKFWRQDWLLQLILIK